MASRTRAWVVVLSAVVWMTGSIPIHVTEYRAPKVHIGVLSTAQSADGLRCWMRWMEEMMTSDTLAVYELRVRSGSLGARAAGTSSFKSAHWKVAVKLKVSFLKELLSEVDAQGARTVGPHDVLVMTDLDVLPLAPYGTLLDADVGDVTFMSEFKDRGYNCGFFAARNTARTRALVANWALADMSDGNQGPLNALADATDEAA